MARHWELILRWNDRTNLTSILDPAGAALLHYRDSLEALAVLLGDGETLDIGSGAGFPGVPIAIVRPEPIVLMEPRRKRASFLRTVKAELGLSHVTVVEGRSSDSVSRTFRNVLTRATFSDPTALRDCLRWVAPSGQLVALRGYDDGASGAPRSHRYRLGDRERALDIWTHDGLSVR